MGAGDVAPTSPYCRACGWDFVRSPNLDDDAFCDSCGDDLAVSVGPGIDPPAALDATGGSLVVTFTWTDNVAADSTDFRSSIDGADWVVVSPDTSPTAITAAEGEVVTGQVRSIIDGVTGPWSAVASDTATA
jgi:hypothetical protein